jgi:hypothetical protein
MRLLTLVALSVSIALAAANTAASPPEIRVPQTGLEFLAENCKSCHNAEKQRGHVRLDDLPAVLGDIRTAERWQKILNVLNSGEMPPPEEKQPLAPAKQAFLESLSQIMVEARLVLNDSGGETPLRRLNQREYVHAIRDLLGVTVDASLLPADGSPGVFDTSGRSLFLSSDQLEQYLATARSAWDLALRKHSKPWQSRFEPETVSTPDVRSTIARITRNAPGGSSGRKYLDPKDKAFYERQVQEKLGPATAYLERPESRTGTLISLAEPIRSIEVPIALDAPPGRYSVRIHAAALSGVPESRHFLEIGYATGKRSTDRRTLTCMKVHGTLGAPETLDFVFELPASGGSLSGQGGDGRQLILRERQHNDGSVYKAQSRSLTAEGGAGIPPSLWVDWVECKGPLPPVETSPAQALLRGAQDNAAGAQTVLRRFATRAFRGHEPSQPYLSRLLAHYQQGKNQGASFQEALKDPLSIILASPSFLYLQEPRPQETAAPAQARQPTPISGLELASRLAFFLWSAPPDERLLDLGKTGHLLEPKVLEAETDRLLASPKNRDFVCGFLQQWLQMERLDFFQFNARLHPEFDENVKRAAREEVVESFRLVLRDNLPLATLLKSDFVCIDELLADYYGLPAPRQPGFQKVQIPEGTPRGGLLGMAAILAMGSDGERTSPVERGAWILRKLLHTPPPPAPANVPQLSRLSGKLLPARDLLAAHREQPQCAQCHQRIDPIGFGLENFSASGRWRQTEYTEVAQKNRVQKTQEHPIDSSGQLPDGQKFHGFFELRDAIEGKQAAFETGFAENLLSYALGRPFGFTDQILREEILEFARNRGGTPRAVIHGVVRSRAFKSK